MIPDSYLEQMNVADSVAFWQRILASGSRDVSVLAAVDAELVVGFASGNRRNPPKLGFDAELSAIHVAPQHRRRGIGRDLVAAVAAGQRASGAHGLLTFVIAGNRGARTFFERLGAELLIEQPFQWDGTDLVETGYGWRDLDALAARGRASPALH